MRVNWARRLTGDQRGITGLETAIILIAFIMVASVFAYVVLSAGLFSSQEAKEVVYEGVEEARSTIQLRGNVLARMEDGIATEVYFTVGSMAVSEPVDFTDTSEGDNVVVISYSDAYNQYPSLDWTMERISTMNDDNLLDANELFQVTVDLAQVNWEDWEADPPQTPRPSEQQLVAYRGFTLEVKPPNGAVLTIERTLPARVEQVVNLY